jgi:hypothetical protein
MKKFDLSQVKSMVLDVETLGMILAYLDSIVELENDLRKNNETDIKSPQSYGRIILEAFSDDIGPKMVETLKNNKGYESGCALLASKDVCVLIFDGIGFTK